MKKVNEEMELAGTPNGFAFFLFTSNAVARIVCAKLLARIGMVALPLRLRGMQLFLLPKLQFFFLYIFFII